MRRWESRIQRCHRGDQVLVVRPPALDCLAAVGPSQHLQSARVSRRDMLAAGIPAVSSGQASWSNAERGSLQLRITRPWRLACPNDMQLSSSPVERRSARSPHRPPRGAPQRRAPGVHLPGPGGRGPGLRGHRLGGFSDGPAPPCTNSGTVCRRPTATTVPAGFSTFSSLLLTPR